MVITGRMGIQDHLSKLMFANIINEIKVENLNTFTNLKLAVMFIMRIRSKTIRKL